MEEKKIDDKFLKRLIREKVKIKINCKDGGFYTATITGASDIGISFLDKFNSEIYIAFDDILKIVPTKDNRNSEGKKYGLH